ncbi:MAG: hypothetical protein ABMA00_17335 [Gemmatimonas sp.]
MNALHRRSLAVSAAVVLGIVLTAVAYRPGVMSGDSLFLYGQALREEVSSGKPPLTAFIWMWILKLWPSPTALLMVQAGLFWAGLGAIVHFSKLRTSCAALAVLGIGLWPAVFALIGTLWLDVWLAAWFLLFVGMALTAMARRSTALLMLSFIPLWSGLSTRLNALPAVMPLAIWIVALFDLRFNVGRRTRSLLAVSAGLMVVLVGTSLVFARAVTPNQLDATGRPLQMALYHDLAGISVRSGVLVMPSHVYDSIPNLTLADVTEAYDPADANRLIYDPRWSSWAFYTSDVGKRRELRALWARTVTANPLRYVQVRLEVMATILQLQGVFYPFHVGIDKNELGLEFPPRASYERMTGVFTALAPFLFRGWIYAGVALAVVIVGARRRRWTAVAVSASGLCYVLPYFVVTTGSDYRYVLWMVVATLISLLLFIGEPIAWRVPASARARDATPEIAL